MPITKPLLTSATVFSREAVLEQQCLLLQKGVAVMGNVLTASRE